MDITGMSLTQFKFPLVTTETNTGKYYNTSTTKLFYESATIFRGKITLIPGLDKTYGDHQSKTHAKIPVLQPGIYIFSVSERTKDIRPNT